MEELGVVGKSTVGSLREASADLAVQTITLPVLHGDVARERVQQVDVALRVVRGLPVVLGDVDDLEEPAGNGIVVHRFYRSGPE